jgi:DNA polymerase/3'-5' exonuclease PolX
LSNIKGFGPKSLYTLYQTIKFKNRKELIDILEKNKVPKIKGIGNKKLMKLIYKTVKKNNKMRVNYIKMNDD